MAYLSSKKLKELSDVLEKMDEWTYAEMDLVMRMLTEHKDMGALQRVWYDPYQKCMMATYVKFYRKEETIQL